MRFFIVTDIHGSAYWAERAVSKFSESDADVLVVLGDVYNHGPRNPFPQDYAPMKVAEILGGVPNIIVIQGNCDSEVDQMISSFRFVKESFVPVGARRFLFTHGHVCNKFNLLGLNAGDVVFYGHTHVNEIADVNGGVCVNVGSCALPKDGVRPYCIADDKEIVLCDFDGNVVARKAL